MKMNKAIKRIVALGTGVTMVGATILGAMAAADFNVYPKPFVDNGAFNALIVVGSQAKTEDVLGSIDIATSLQYANRITKTIPGTTASASVSGEGVKIEGTNNKLNIGEDLVAAKAKIDESDLPELLADGIYVADGDDDSDTFAYTQKLEFEVGPDVEFKKSTEYKDDQNPYMVLYSGEGLAFMTYTLDFTKDPESEVSADADDCGDADELCDFEGTKIDIMGMNYEVTSASSDGTGITWEMMGGTGLYSMYEGETKTFTIDGEDYEVTVDIVSDTGLDCQLTVNGVTTRELSRGETTRVAGIEIGIKKLMPNEAGEEGAGKDLVQFYLGANKVSLSQADTGVAEEVVVGTDEVDGLTADWTVIHGDPMTLQKLELVWTPEDQVMLAAGEDITFPGLESFKVAYAGLTKPANAEVVSFSPDGDDVVEMSVPLVDGDVTMGILYWGGAAFTLGDSATAGQGIVYMADPSAEIAKGDFIVLSNDVSDETHIVKVKEVNTDDVVTFEDVATGATYEGSCSSLPCTIYVGDSTVALSAVDHEVTIDPKSVTIGTAADLQPRLYTPEGLQIDFATADVGVTYDITFTEEDDNGGVGLGDSFTITAEDGGVDEVSVGTVTDVTAGLSTGYELADTDKYVYMSEFGTKITHDRSDSQESVTIDYPGEEVYADVFVNAIDTQIVEGGEGGATYGDVQRINVGAAVLDTEVANIAAQNVIVVGGPCVNTLAAQLMGNPAECAAGFEDGKAMIKLFDQTGGKVAMLVAGYSAMDTRRASRVVAGIEPGDYSGTELEVTGTSLSDIKVSAPQ